MGPARASRGGLEKDLGGELGHAAGADEIDSLVEVDARVREPLGERKWVAGLDQHVEPPALDLDSLAVIGLDYLCHLAHPFPGSLCPRRTLPGEVGIVTEGLRMLNERATEATAVERASHRSSGLRLAFADSASRGARAR